MLCSGKLKALRTLSVLCYLQDIVSEDSRVYSLLGIMSLVGLVVRLCSFCDFLQLYWYNWHVLKYSRMIFPGSYNCILSRGGSGSLAYNV